jgi:hypothetical protein
LIRKVVSNDGYALRFIGHNYALCYTIMYVTRLLNFALYTKVTPIITIALQLLAAVHLIVEIIDAEQLLSE